MATIEVSDVLALRIEQLRAAQEANIHQLPSTARPDPQAGNAPIAPIEPDAVDVVEAAVSLLEVHWVRDEDGRAPVELHRFQKLYSRVPADPQLRQRSAKDFDLSEPFVYRGKVAPDAAEDTTWVIARTPESTDFASIPGFLTWLIPRYGRHTMAALVHDHLQSLLVPEPVIDLTGDGQRRVTSTQADYIMRDAMAFSGVPFVLRWIIWTGISVRTLVTKPSLHVVRGLVAALFVLLYGVGVGVIGVGWLLTLPIVRLSGGTPWSVSPVAVVAALLSPFLLSLLWLPRWRTGVIAAYVLVLVALPVVFITIARCAYWFTELVAKLRPRYTQTLPTGAVAFDHNPISEATWAGTTQPERDEKLNQVAAQAPTTEAAVPASTS